MPFDSALFGSVILTQVTWGKLVRSRKSICFAYFAIASLLFRAMPALFTWILFAWAVLVIVTQFVS
ncbi:MAG TPA: hypothetical protein V6D29_19980 [Leptolyngbyaceae cyanobacterium]